MQSDLTKVEVLGLAIRSEEDAAKLYGEISKLVNNDLVKARFEQLAREEVGHKAILIGIYKKVTGDRNPPKIPGKPHTAESQMEIAEPKSIEEALLYAIELEQKASAFYLNAAKQAKEPSIVQLFNYLADMEHGHEMMLKLELDAFRRDENWYAEKPDIQLVGP